MGGGTKVIIGLIMVAVLMIVFPIVMSATHDLQTENQTDAGLACISDPEDVTLTKDLWNADIGSVISGVDSEGNVLTATAYVEATRVLTVTGWVTPADTCTIVYETDALTSYTGMSPLVGITPLLIWIAIIAIVIGGTWFAFKHG
jgi:hypothetical protein